MIIEWLKKIKHSLEDRLEWMEMKHSFCRGLKKKHIILIGTPLHGNIGDQAITLAEYEFFEKLGYRVCEIPSPYVIPQMERWKKLIGNQRIYVHGGGFIGSLWPEEEQMLEAVLRNFCGNEIIVLPQTIYFEHPDASILKLNRILKDCRNVTICAREKYSYEFARERLKHANIILAPDMVLSQNWKPEVQSGARRNEVLFCMRKDHEKKISEQEVEHICKMIRGQYPDIEIRFTDTVIPTRILPKNRKAEILRMIRELSEAKLVVTDRLHGMVLAAMAETPTLVCSNCNYKVHGIYLWIQENPYIYYCEEMSQIPEGIRLLQQQSCCYRNRSVLKEFAVLEKMAGYQER